MHKKVPLFVYFIEGILGYNTNDPTKCTAVKSVFEGNFHRVKKLPKGCIVLDVTSDKVLSKKDAKHAKKGVCVIDGSWYIIPETILSFGKKHAFRRLPDCKATNPHHKGTTMISSVEAVAQALSIMGFKKQAKEILEPFPWAANFLQINGKHQ